MLLLSLLVVLAVIVDVVVVTVIVAVVVVVAVVFAVVVAVLIFYLPNGAAHRQQPKQTTYQSAAELSSSQGAASSNFGPWTVL